MKISLGAGTTMVALPVWCVGSYDAGGKPNVMTVAWGGICCSKPPCVTISLRKATYTYGNIMDRRAYTVNVPSEQYVRQADYFGVVSGRDVDKFAATGLTPVRSELVDAPYVGEFPMVLECSVVDVHDIGLHTQFIGKILDVKIDEEFLGGDDRANITKIRPLVFGTVREGYYRVGEFIGHAYQIGRAA